MAPRLVANESCTLRQHKRVRARASSHAGRAYHLGRDNPGRFQPAMGLLFFREAAARRSRGWGGCGIQGNWIRNVSYS